MKLDREGLRSAVVAGLPARAHWVLREMPVDFDFTTVRRGFRPLSSDDLAAGEPEADWADLLIFGRYDCAEGGGAAAWIAIRQSDGSVWGLDVEREDATFRFNTTLERFVRTFALLDRYLGYRQPLASDIEATMRALDPAGYPDSEWRSLIDYVKGV